MALKWRAIVLSLLLYNTVTYPIRTGAISNVCLFCMPGWIQSDKQSVIWLSKAVEFLWILLEQPTAERRLPAITSWHSQDQQCRPCHTEYAYIHNMYTCNAHKCLSVGRIGCAAVTGGIWHVAGYHWYNLMQYCNHLPVCLFNKPIFQPQNVSQESLKKTL